MPSVPEQWNLAWAEFGREHPVMKHLPSGLAFLIFTVLGQSALGLIQVVSPFLPLIAWPLMFLATTVLAEMFVINFSGKSYNRRIVALEDKLCPNLNIVFERDSDEFVQKYPAYRDRSVTQYRICVFSPGRIEDAELVVNKLSMAGITYNEIHLRPMGERNARGTRRVGLKPFKAHAWDFISTFSDGEVVLNHLPRSQQIMFPVGVYEFELMASGGDRPPATKIVTLEVREDKTVDFGIRDGRLSRPLI